MADKQIFRTGPVDAPFTYELEPSEAFQPLIIQAVLDGSAAVVPWLPAVEYVSREGHVIGRAVTDSPLGAGDDAEVTWFPGVKRAAAAPAAASGIPWAYTHSNPAGQNIPSTNTETYFSIHDTGGAERFETSDAAVFANASTNAFTGVPVWGIQFNAPGTYMIQGNFFWRAQGTTGRGIGGYWTLSLGSAPSLFQFGRTSANTGDAWDKSGAAPGLPHLSFYEFISVSAAQLGGVGALWAKVASGGASSVTAQMMAFKISDYVAAEL